MINDLILQLSINHIHQHHWQRSLKNSFLHLTQNSTAISLNKEIKVQQIQLNG